MKEIKNLKIERWTKKDVVKNVITYVLNTVLIIGVIILMGYINCLKNGLDFENEYADGAFFINISVLVAIIVAVSFMYFYFENKNFLRVASNSEMLFLIVELSLAVNFIIGEYVSPFLRPVASVALLVGFLADRKKAFYINTIFSFLILIGDIFVMSDLTLESFSVLLITFCSGTVALILTAKDFSRYKILFKGIFMGIPAIIFCLLIMLGDTTDFALKLVASFCSGLASVVVFLTLLPVFELIFKRVTTFKLEELTDHNGKLLKKLISGAPGTFNHAIIVSNLAEACAIAIGEDALLARACAYYHDMGKLRRPEYFTENQTENKDLHEELTPELSANIIRSHTKDGYNLLIKNGFPKIVADVCLEHHGTMPIIFFYNKAKTLTDGDVDIKQYSYAGPKPQSKIAAIIMIADGCEAVSRTLADRSRASVMKVVRKVINDRLVLGQFDECEITIKDLDIITNTIVNHLSGVYHSRIEYPKIFLSADDKEQIKEGQTLKNGKE